MVWHYCSKSDTIKIEKIQERALRYVYCDFNSSYSTLRDRAEKPLLYTQRLQKIVCEVYKCINNITPSYSHKMFNIKNNSRSLRNKYVLDVPMFNTVKFGKTSLCYEGAKLWNSLDNNVKCSDSLYSFKQNIGRWQGPSCTCSFCIACVLNNL